MADVSKNPLVKGARGNFGKEFVYRTRGNKTHMARMPVSSEGMAPTEKQEDNRKAFSYAVQYARSAVANEKLKKLYQKKAEPGGTAYNIALKDYLKAPVVTKINTHRYSGAGSEIIIKAKDDFRVARVILSIRSAERVLIEEGDAALEPVFRKSWSYTASQINSSVPGCIISATAYDIPGNKGVLEVVV